MTREQEAVVRKVHRARESLARKYGNLYGIKLNRWFAFNGEHAVPIGDGAKERKQTLDLFELSVSALHRARRAAA